MSNRKNIVEGASGTTDKDITSVMALIEKCLCTEFVPYLKGQSGIGKTRMIQQMADRKGWHFRMYNCTYADFADWGLYTKMEGGVEAVIPEHMQWLFNAEYPTLVLVDELPLAPEMIQGNLMALFNERHIRGKALSPHVHFIAAGNRPQDKVGGNAIKWPLASRVAVFEVEVGTPYVKAWGEYMRGKGTPEVFVSAVLDMPDMLNDAKPNTTADKEGGDPRSWDLGLSILTGAGINCATATGRNQAKSLMAAYVGQANAQQFVGFVRNQLSMPQIEALLKDPSGHPLPDEPDQLLSLGKSLAFHADTDTVDSVATIIDRVPPEMRERILKDILVKKPHLAAHKSVIALAVKDSAVAQRQKTTDVSLGELETAASAY